MDADLIKSVATQVVDQTILHNWEYWLLVAGFAFLIGCGASYLGSYWSRRGEVKAAKADRREILEQLRETTKTTARINSIVSLGEWTERERHTLRRTKLEEVLIAAHKTLDWLDVEEQRLIWRLKYEDRASPSPMPIGIALGKLYIPELESALKAFESAAKDYETHLLKVNVLMAEARRAAKKSGEPRTAEWRASVARDGTNAELLEKFGVVQAALSALDSEAATLMADIIAVPPAEDS